MILSVTLWGLTVPDWLSFFFQYKSYFILFIAAALSTMLGTPIYILLASKMGWVDQPAGRKAHARPTPTMGGLVIFAVVFAGALVALRLPNQVGDNLRARAHDIYALIACTACMLLLGMIDDQSPIRAKVKLLVQAVVAVGAVSVGFRVESITLPFMESAHLPMPIGVVLSLLWIVGITNAINLTDGLDGLAAGIGFLASMINAIVAIWLGNYYMTVMMVLLAGALLGFLRWNFHPAKVFLGDTGSMALGMYLAISSMASAQKSHTVVMILAPLFALGYPIFDTLLAVARRMVRGQPLFASDRDHIHHRLLQRGKSPSAVTIQIYLASILIALACIAAMTANHFVVGLGIVGALAIAWFSARVLGYLEWGGWMARWSGREETKALHAAAQLARLRIEGARQESELVSALATIAPEIGCHEITLARPSGSTTQWQDPFWKGPAGIDFEIGLNSSATLHFRLEKPLDPECGGIVEELGRLASSRVDHPEPNQITSSR